MEKETVLKPLPTDPKELEAYYQTRPYFVALNRSMEDHLDHSLDDMVEQERGLLCDIVQEEKKQ